VRAYFGLNKFEQMRQRIINELQNSPINQQQGQGQQNNNGAIEEETKEDEVLNQAGIHAYSYVNK